MKSKWGKNALSKTPRGHTHNRKVHFAISMREKISKTWVALRKGMRKKNAEKSTSRKKSK